MDQHRSVQEQHGSVGDPGLEKQLALLARIDVLYIVADWTDEQPWNRDAGRVRQLLRLAALAQSLWCR